jgi:uncharacterized protein with PIN domain
MKGKSWSRLEAVVFCGETDCLKFVADGMLGKLTRWLRMLGQDVKYSNDMEDSQLLNIARKEKRILLTRDFELYQRAVGNGMESFYFQGETSEEKLAELAQRFSIPLEMDMTLSRCPKCNTIIKPLSANKAAEQVQKNTLAHYKEFWKCPKCGQVYWQGAHWIKIKKTLRDADEIRKESKKKEN